MQTDKNVDEPIFPVIEYGVTEAAIAELRERYAEPDASTNEGYALCKEGVKELTSIRTAIERRRKDLKRDALDWGRKVDRRAAEITAQIKTIEEPVRIAKDVVDEETRRAAREAAEAEAKRKADIEAMIAGIKEFAKNRDDYANAAAIGQAIAHVEAEELTERRFEEYLEEATTARDAVLYRLAEWHDAAVRREDEDKQRAAEEARLKAAREALEDEQRKTRLRSERQRSIDDLRAVPANFIGASTDVIQRAIAKVTETDVSETRWGDQAPDARAARESTLERLREMHSKQESVEAEDRRRADEDAERSAERARQVAREAADRAAEEERIREAEEREEERKAAAQAEALLPEIEKARRWIAGIEQAVRLRVDLIDQKLFKICGAAFDDVERITDRTRRSLDKLEPKR